VKDARSYDGLSVSWQGDDRASTSVVANSIETYWRSQSCVLAAIEEAMSDHPDLPKANHALQVLRQARLSRNEAAAVMIGDLIYEIAYTGQRSPEIEDAHQTAWLAISELARALKKERFAPPALWKAAFRATENWKELLI
jgi:hypothetical protein